MLRKATMIMFIKEIKSIFEKGTTIGTKSTGCAGYPCLCLCLTFSPSLLPELKECSANIF